MKRFENAQVGDKVYCLAYGDGEIDRIDCDTYAVSVQFENGAEEDYTLDGLLYHKHKNPLLFYRKGEQRNLTERPEPETDWTKVPRGTELRVWNSGKDKVIRNIYDYAPEMPHPFVVMDAFGHVYAYENAELIKEEA